MVNTAVLERTLFVTSADVEVRSAMFSDAKNPPANGRFAPNGMEAANAFPLITQPTLRSKGPFRS
jgi:hypothetical protein